MMSKYWSCTTIADKIRGTDKPVSATAEGWDSWNDSAKLAHPVRYWIVEEGFDYIQGAVMYIPNILRSAHCYIYNRYVRHSHALVANTANIQRGSYTELGSQILPCLFDSLVDYVEIEKAWMNVVFDDSTAKKYKLPWRQTKWYAQGLTTWRNVEAGMAYLEWEMTVSDDGNLTPQAIAAAEIRELYLWYKTTYRDRPDPSDESGWSAWCDHRFEEGKSPFNRESTEARVETSRLLTEFAAIEAKYEAEDTEMLIRLIKIRNSLWT